MKPNIRTFIFSLGTLLLLATSVNALAEAASASKTERQVEGLWFYTGLATSDGVERPLTGIFLFKDGVFLQQAVFNGEPFEAQGAMAHAGPYRPEAGWVHLTAEQTISTDPQQQAPLSSRGITEHEVTVSRDCNAMTLVFNMGKGTVQRFERIGAGEGEVHALKDGMMALVDGYFVLVQGNADGSVSGYGTYTRTGNDLAVNIIRWTEADSSRATNVRDTKVQVTFDGKTLTLADGRRFETIR